MMNQRKRKRSCIINDNTKAWRRPNRNGKRGLGKNAKAYVLEEHLCYPRLMNLQSKCPSNSKHYMDLVDMFAGLAKTGERRVGYDDEDPEQGRLTAEFGSLHHLEKRVWPFVISKALLRVDITAAATTMMVYRSLRLNAELPEEQRRSFRRVFPSWQYVLTDRETVVEVVCNETGCEDTEYVENMLMAIANGGQQSSIAGCFSDTLHTLVDEVRKEFSYLIETEEVGLRWFEFWKPLQLKQCDRNLARITRALASRVPTISEVTMFLSRLYREDERTVVEIVCDHLFDEFDARPSCITSTGVFFRLDDVDAIPSLQSIVMLETTVLIKLPTTVVLPVTSDEWESQIDSLFQVVQLPSDWNAGDKPVLIDSRLVTSRTSLPLVRKGNICCVFSQTGYFNLANGRSVPVTRESANWMLGQDCEFVFGREAFSIETDTNREEFDISECLPRFQDVLVFRHPLTTVRHVFISSYEPVVLIPDLDHWDKSIVSLNHRTKKPFEHGSKFNVIDIRRKDLPTRSGGTGYTMPLQDFSPSSPRVRVVLAACGLGKTHQVAHGIAKQGFSRVLVPVPRITLAIGANDAYDNLLDLQVYKHLSASQIADADQLAIELESIHKIITGCTKEERGSQGKYDITCWDEIFMIRGAWISATTNGRNMKRNHAVAHYIAFFGKHVLMDATGEVDGSVKELICDLFPDDVGIEVVRVRGGAINREVIPLAFDMSMVLMSRMILNNEPIMCMFQTLNSKTDGLLATLKALNLPEDIIRDNVVVISSNSDPETIERLSDPGQNFKGKSVFFTSKLVVGLSFDTHFSATFTIGSSKGFGASSTCLYQMDNRSRAVNIPHYQSLHGYKPPSVTFDECHTAVVDSERTVQDYVNTLSMGGELSVVEGKLRFYTSLETRLCAWKELENREDTGYAYKRISETQGVVVTSKCPLRMYTDAQVALQEQLVERLQVVPMQLDIDSNVITARARRYLEDAYDNNDISEYINRLTSRNECGECDALEKHILVLWFSVFFRFDRSQWKHIDDASANMFSKDYHRAKTRNVRTFNESKVANDVETLVSKAGDYYANAIILTRGRTEAMFQVLAAAGMQNMPKIGDEFSLKSILQRSKNIDEAYVIYRALAGKKGNPMRVQSATEAKRMVDKVLIEQLGLKLYRRGDKLRVVAAVNGAIAYRLMDEHNTPENVSLMTDSSPPATMWRASVLQTVRDDLARHTKERRSKKPREPCYRPDGSEIEPGGWTGPCMVDKTVAPMTQVVRAHNDGNDMDNVEPVDIYGVPIARLEEALQLFRATGSIQLPDDPQPLNAVLQHDDDDANPLSYRPRC